MSNGHFTRRKQSREQVQANVLTDTVEGIRQEAEARDVPVGTLIATLLDTIAKDQMYDAVLDGEFPRKVGGA